ncbi:MAG: PAS domain S-box protein [Hyphomonas sp.]
MPKTIERGSIVAPRKRLPSGVVTALKLLAVFVLAMTLASVAIALTRGEGRIAAIWPINAVLFIVLLKHKREEWALLLAPICAGLLSANLLVGDAVAPAVLFTTANSLEIVLVAAIFVQGRLPRMISPRGVLRLLFAALAGCAVSTVTVVVGQATLGAEFRTQDVALWFAADSLGYMLAAPVIWSLIDRSRRNYSKTNFWDSTFQLSLLFVITTLVFIQTMFPLLFLVAPILVWLAFSGGARRAAEGMLVVAAVSLVFTLDHKGPVSLVKGAEVTQILILQVFLATNAMLAMAVGAIMSERRRLFVQLERSKARLTSVTRQQKEMLGKARLAESMSGVGHWTLNVETSEVYWSPEVYAIHGVDPDEFDPSYNDAVDFYSEADRPRIHAIVAASFETGEGWEFEADLVRRSDGAVRHVKSLGECIQDASGKTVRVFGVFKDVTEERQTLKDIADRESHYRILAEYSTDVILQIGHDGIIKYASPSCRLFGKSVDELVGSPTYELVIEEDRAHQREVNRANFSGKTLDKDIRREFRIRDADGNIRWMEGNPRVIRSPDGAPLSVISTFRDVTERIEREEALSKARADAESAARAKSEFLSNMSHEIRTPLNGVLGFTQLIQQTGLSVEQHHFVDRIASAGRTLREIVDDILDFSKIEAGKMEVEARPFELGSVVREVIDLVDAGRANKSVAIYHNTKVETPLTLVGDQTRVRQILTNILGNATKFTQRGKIEVTVANGGDQFEIFVKDTGTGIPEDRIAAIFEGFQQADSSVTRRFGGTGLGLSISRSLARLMGGDISIESREGAGTLVCIRLPNAATTGGANHIADEVDAPALAQAARVMVVDDVEMNLELVQIGLSGAGHSVTTFNSAKEAIRSLEKGTVFDIVLMDVQMPEMDGPTATKIIRTLPGPICRVPIVALTAHALSSEVAEFLEAGMTAHFPKPIDLERLDRLVRQLARPEMREVTKPDESAAKTLDPIVQLQLEYRDYLATVSGEVETILALTSDIQVLNAVGALAHAIAGTAGSLGFWEVSEAAFELEAAAKKLRRTSDSARDLDSSIDKFLDTISRVGASAASG